MTTQRKWTGSGVIIPGRRIVTNAHVVTSQGAPAAVLRVRAHNNPEKFLARVVAMAHDVDLAVVAVDDDAFWEGIESGSSRIANLATKPFPEMYSGVQVVGFPTGGDTLCVTRGVLSRIDAHLYAHAQRVCVAFGPTGACALSHPNKNPQSPITLNPTARYLRVPR